MADASESAAEIQKKARELSSAMSDFSSASSSAAAQANDLSNSFSQISNGAINFTKQISNGTDTFSKFSGSINQLSDGTGDLIFALGKGNPFMIGLGLMTKALGAIVGKVLENDDAITSSYDKIASFGGASCDTLLILYEQAGKIQQAIQ
jgi:hypothetical protein